MNKNDRFYGLLVHNFKHDIESHPIYPQGQQAYPHLDEVLLVN
jgi:hypothetical protein